MLTMVPASSCPVTATLATWSPASQGLSSPRVSWGGLWTAHLIPMGPLASVSCLGTPYPRLHLRYMLPWTPGRAGSRSSL